MEQASITYSEKTSLRAAIQVVPYVGGALDTLLAGKGGEIQQRRIDYFLNELNERLNRLEAASNIDQSEEALDLFTSIFDGVVKTRSDSKIKNFASIVTHQIGTASEWEEAETATRILKDLDEIHIRVLLYTIESPICSSPFDGLRVVTLSDKPHGSENENPPSSLFEAFPEYNQIVLRMICSELVSKSLLYDEGVGRMDTKAMTYFVSTELASWFLNWIRR